MADQKLTELGELLDPISSDLMYLVEDPGGSPLSKKASIGTILGADGAWVNLVKNTPGQIVTDGAEPQWWDDVANATITDEDAAGEGIPEKQKRVFKVVTSANDVYGYQTFTFADEDLLDAGITKVSFSCWVYCADSAKASVGVYGANLGLYESDQHPGDSAWHLLAVENITLDAGDAEIQVRLIVDTGTAYFTMPMLNVGSKALPWRERGQRPVSLDTATSIIYESGFTETVGFTPADVTAGTHPLATKLEGTVLISSTAAKDWRCYMRPAYSSQGATEALVRARTTNAITYTTGFTCALSDQQVLEYHCYNVTDATTMAAFGIFYQSYWRWE